MNNENHSGEDQTTERVPIVRKVFKRLSAMRQRYPWKADFNQCTGRQLSGAVRRAQRKHDPKGQKRLPFVLIGHSKLFTKSNERSLTSFLDYVGQNPKLLGFATFRGPFDPHERRAIDDSSRSRNQEVLRNSGE